MEDVSKYQSVTVGVTFKANNTLKASKVGHCALWSSWLSCLQLWHEAYFWHVRNTYLADFRQDPTESTADLDLCIKQTVGGCQWKRDTEEERMTDLLYHATTYYEIHKYIKESEPATLKYEMVIEKAKEHERNILE